MSQPLSHILACVAACMCASQLVVLSAAEHGQWGERHSRNMVSAEVNLPAEIDPRTGHNIRWCVPLGTRCYSTPVAAGGKVLIGTNNSAPRDPHHEGDRGVLMCFDASDGSLCWQLVVPKLDSDIFLDWPQAGICSPATVEGDRVYTVTNRDEVVCLDLNGMANGNDGPFQDEATHMVPAGSPPLETGPLDADIIWLLDLRAAAGVRPHDSAHSSILLDGANLYLNTSNGLNSKHTGVEKPDAPSLVVVDKATGQLVARDREPIGPRIFHCTWSSPALGEVAGQRRIFFAGGDGVCYGFAALPPDRAARESPAPTVAALDCVWRFDCDPTAPKENVHQYIRNRQVSPSNIKSMPVFYQQRLYVTHGGDIWWGKNQAWLKCIDATGIGDVTDSNLLWSYELAQHCCSTPAIHDGLAYVGDLGGKLHCVDIASGQPCWVYEGKGEIWASPLVADGKVFVGNRRGQLFILAAGRQERELCSVRLDSEIAGSCTAADATVYVATMTQLYALRKQTDH